MLSSESADKKILIIYVVYYIAANGVIYLAHLMHLQKEARVHEL